MQLHLRLTNNMASNPQKNQLGKPHFSTEPRTQKAHGKSLGKVARMRAEDLQKQLEQVSNGRFNGTTDGHSSRII